MTSEQVENKRFEGIKTLAFFMHCLYNTDKVAFRDFCIKRGGLLF